MVVLTDRYGELSETFVATEVAALRRAGADVVVESLAGTGADRVWEHESTAERARAMVELALRNPLGCLRDLAARRRWRREEPVPPLRMLAPAALRYRRAQHVHVHFAAGAALAALRIHLITGTPYSVTAHAWDIYQRPANLAEKLRGAAFSTSGCEYTVRDLRRLTERAPVIVMGVDGERFSRRTPYPGARTVVAVGRLIEKKGFADLVRAVALLERPPDRLVIAGAGPLEGELRELARQLDVALELPGALDHDAVRDLLEAADVLCMPSVIAADGDRDSMPVVVKEALAMEVPVIATDEVGLPELVRAPWGTLVAPHDPPALAAALEALLARDPADRAEMGRAGRAHVLAHCNPDAEAAKLLHLI